MKKKRGLKDEEMRRLNEGLNGGKIGSAPMITNRGQPKLKDWAEKVPQRRQEEETDDQI